MNFTMIAIIALVAAAAGAALTAIILKAVYSGKIDVARKETEMQKQVCQEAMRAVRAEITSQTEQILKSRQKELDEHAQKTFSDITSGLDKDLKEMKESFEKTSRTSAQTTAELKENISLAVKHLADQTADVGRKADNLAGAMRAEVKGQGIWGESLFENMLEAEGFVKGRDYNREDVLRDDLGFTVRDEDGRGLRPDFVLHYPDDTDVIVDSKVSVRALADYIAAGTEEEKSDAARRNLDAVWEQVCRLARKDYVRYKAKSRRKTLDYVLMFVPNYGAMQLAKQSDPDIWRKAFEKNVLIITEETAMPFLRMIRSAWASYDQVRSQKLIVEAAERMLDRVAEFSKAHAEMGKSLEKARECYDKCDLKLRDSGQSIAVAARAVVKLGVPSKKPLPPVLGSDADDVPAVSASGEFD